MMKAKKIFVLFFTLFFIYCLAGCSGDSNSSSGNDPIIKKSEPKPITEQTLNDTSDQKNVEEDNAVAEQEIMPSKEEVLAMRSLVLAGMSQDEIDRLTENIKVANQQMEHAYLYDNLFSKLEDKNHLYWNYFDQKGDIQIGWAYDGTISDIQEICKKENITSDAFYEKYGTPVMVYNRFDGNSFIELLLDMKNSVHNEDLQSDIQYMIDETKLAVETHDMEHANNIYKSLHDMDYFLLRYGLEDGGKYTHDVSVVATYYGVLSVYAKTE